MILFFISSCGIKKNIVHELESINVTEIIDKINSNQINSNWLYFKGKIKILSNNDKVSLGVSLKIRKDSLIWASISAPIIGEINRIMITPDSLYVINRTNSTWSTQPIGQLKKEIGASLSYYDIQNFLSNTVKIPVQLKTENQEPSLHYVTHLVNINDILITDKTDSVSYLINSDNELINQININYSQNQNLKIEYSDFLDNYAKRLNIIISKPKLSVELLYNKIQQRDIDKISFKIPEKYMRRLNRIFFVFVLTPVFCLVSKQGAIKTTKTINRKRNILYLFFVRKNKRKQKNSLQYINYLDKKIDSQERLIKISNIELNLTKKQIIKLENKIKETENQINQKDSEIIALKKEYGKMLYSLQKNKNDRNNLMFIMSSETFNQAYKRVLYLREYSRLRKSQALQIQKSQDSLLANSQRLIKQKELITKKKEENLVLIEEKKKNLNKILSLSKRKKILFLTYKNLKRFFSKK